MSDCMHEVESEMEKETNCPRPFSRRVHMHSREIFAKINEILGEKKRENVKVKRLSLPLTNLNT